jgi:hypothetical protein
MLLFTSSLTLLFLACWAVRDLAWEHVQANRF